MGEVHPDIAAIALAKAEGFEFERFINDLYPRVVGNEYVPLGGYKDGGADAFGGDPVYERVGKVTHFYQASVQLETAAKIRNTAKRLKEFGRDVRVLTYLTSRTVITPDKVENDLTDELDITIRIHDGKYITSLLNESPATQACFDRHLRHLTEYINHFGSSLLAPSQYVSDPTVFVFLRQESDKRQGDGELIESLTDTLTLWALEGTDPDKNILMSRDDILKQVETAIPSAVPEMRSKLDHRLRMLSSKDFPGGRRIKYHVRENAYVLPYEIRKTIQESNAGDESLVIRVRDGFIERAKACSQEPLNERDLESLGNIAIRTLQIAFEKQGLLFSHFLSNSDDTTEYPALADAAKEAIFEAGVTGTKSVEFAIVGIRMARQSLYASTSDEREYLRRLSRTYTLLFTLKNEPRVANFFARMASDFYLYVGSDLIIRALSETCLQLADQLSRNTLVFSAQAGMKLILTEPVLEEVLGNLRIADREYVSTYEKIELSLTGDLIREIPQIMLRTYLYNRKLKGGRSNWPAFIEQFLSHGSLHKPIARSDLKTYLIRSFGMEFIPKYELQEMTDQDEVIDVAARLREFKKSDRLAENDALMACAVYGQRKATGDGNKGSEFGYNTWWLTGEYSILRATRSLVYKHDGARYMMRPEFLLNFLSLAPSASAIRSSYANIFPSMLGLQISRQMDEGTFRNIIARVTEAQTLDEGRRVAVIAKHALGGFHGRADGFRGSVGCLRQSWMNGPDNLEECRFHVEVQAIEFGDRTGMRAQCVQDCSRLLQTCQDSLEVVGAK